MALRVTSSHASPQEEGVTNVAVAGRGRPTWMGAVHGMVPEAEVIGAAFFVLHTSPSGLAVHVVDACSAYAQRPGSVVLRRQGTYLPFHQPARPKLGSGRVASAATQGWGAPSLGGTAELALGGRPV